MSVDGFTESLRLIIYALSALLIVWSAAELAAAAIRRRRRRPWWRSESASGRRGVKDWPR